MKRFHAVVLCMAISLGVALPGNLLAEEETTRTKFEDLKLKSDPAFVLLEISPEKVDRPTEVSDVAISLRTASNDFSTLPKSYAVSFAPYWLTQKKNVRFSDWAGKSAFPMWKTLSLSGAAHTEGTGDTITTRLAVGLRTSLFRGEVEASFKEDVEADLVRLRAAAKEMRDRLLANGGGGLAGQVIAACDAAQGQPSKELFGKLKSIMAGREVVDPELYAAWKGFAGAFAAEELPATVQDALDDLKDLAETRDLDQAYDAAEIDALVKKLAESEEMKVKGQVPNRTGFNIDLAGAAAWDFPNQIAKAGKMESGAGWLSFAYNWTTWSAVAITRATGRRDARPAYDLGGRFVVDIAEVISPSIEGVVRWENQEKPDYSLSLIVESSLGGSNSLVFSFGRDFQPDLEESLIATIQFVAGFGSAKWFGGEG